MNYLHSKLSQSLAWYRHWHQSRKSTYYHWGVFVVLGLILTSVIYTQIHGLDFSSLSVNFERSQAASPITVPPPDIIRSADGNVEIGISRQYGGAIVYLKDNRIPDSTTAHGNMVDYSNGGTLFTTAIWTLPLNGQEQQYCDEAQKVNGICGGSIPFNNPTQGGYSADGWAGNPNQPVVSISSSKIHVTYRAVNYNYDFINTPLTAANADQWQTDMWGDVDIYFHPTLPDVIVVDTKITYCRDGNAGCSTHTMVTQDNQLSTFFGAGESHPDHNYWGPYTRTVYWSGSAFVYGQSGVVPTPENWVGLVQKNSNNGVGMSINNYAPTIPGRFGYIFGYWPSMSVTQPELSNFETSSVTRRTSVTVNGQVYNDVPRYEFDPGGFYKFRTFVATGDINQVRSSLLAAQNSPFGNSALFVSETVQGTAITSQNQTIAATPGQSIPVSITMKNIGGTTWTVAGKYKLGTQISPVAGDDFAGQVFATDVPNSVSPGSTVTFSISLTAPSTPGTYVLGREMLQDLVEWFGAYTPRVNIAVANAPAPTADIRANGSNGPITIPYNTAATITWSSTNATTCAIASGGGNGTASPPAGVTTGNLTVAATLTLNCTGPGGSASDSVTINVGPAPLAGDLNLDHIVNSLDWSYMNSKWFTADATADINHDGVVNAIDFSVLNSHWFGTW